MNNYQATVQPTIDTTRYVGRSKGHAIRNGEKNDGEIPALAYPIMPPAATVAA